MVGDLELTFISFYSSWSITSSRLMSGLALPGGDGSIEGGLDCQKHCLLSPLRLLLGQGSDQAPGGSVHPSPAPIFSSPALAHWIRIHSYSNDSSCLSQAFSVGFQPVSSFFSGLSSYSSNMPISVGLQPASLVFSRLSCSGSCHSLPGSCSSYLH